jgi:signal transduction histidine kinase/CheY-like chemotaxis protein
MAENIELNSEINEKSAILAGKMLSEDEARKFFESTLQILIEHTSAQMSAVYLLNEQKTFFEHFVSIGITGEAKSAFSAKELEGEFGSAIAAKKIQHIKDIPKTTRFIFNAVNGAFIPHEIITVPIVSGKEVIAIISLANLRPFSAVSIQLIHKIYPTYCARVEGILAYRKMLEFSNRLEAQNQELESQKTELESQKTELEMQSVELSEQNRELESQKNQLQEASKLKTSFLANMSHELRTPLNSVIALSGVLNRKLINRIPSEEYSYIEVIERNGKHLLSLINDILDIARIESGREEIELSEFAICDCVNDVISMISPQIKEKEPQLKPVTGDCDVRITSDLTKVKHILQNLVGNAVKFTEKGEITISVKKIENEISVTVSDTGIGIASEHLAHIFDEFRQADGSASRKFGGTGLGLAIAKKYATLLRGKLTVKSREGVGSDFTLCLPVRLDEQNFSLEKEAYSLKSDFGKRNFQANQKTILLVEDSQPAIIQMKDFLEESGFEVIVAHNGREALQLVSYVIPDAIILDLMMPEIDGFEVLKNIRNAERTIGIPVLILTAKHITKEELQFLKRNNIYQLIQKGDVKREELQKAVAGMVASANVPPLEKEQKGLNEKPSILVIEDNPDNMISIKALLSDKYEVYEAFDGMEGIEKAKKEVPNLILMDIGLKNIDGIETFKRIRLLETLRHIPIVAITANALSENRKEILAHGFDGFIAKPINENDFFKTLKEILNGNDAL